MSIASDKLVKECEEKMLKTIEAVKEKFTAIRAGRANVCAEIGRASCRERV